MSQTIEPPISGTAADGLHQNRWPRPSECDRFFGEIKYLSNGRPCERWEWRSMKDISLPFSMRLGWQPKTHIQRVSCARAVSGSLHRVLSRIWNAYEHNIEDLRSDEADLFWGCYIPSEGALRGSPSMHARGAAIRLGGKETPDCITEAFEAEGWLPAEKLPGQFFAGSK